jgi:hydrogenase nickel incorporation protein HypA/HybF
VHEYSLAAALLERIDAEAHARGATAVKRVRVQVGELSGVEAEFLGWAFEQLREATVCAGAPLQVVRVPARWECPACGREVERDGVLRCPDCEVPARLVAGHELVLESLELQVPDSARSS